MKDKVINGLLAIVLGFLIMVGMRIAEWTIDKPKVQLLVCITEKQEAYGHCKLFDEYIKENDL